MENLIEKGTEVFLIATSNAKEKVINQLSKKDLFDEKGEPIITVRSFPVIITGNISERAYRYFQNSEEETYYEITYRLDGIKNVFSGDKDFYIFISKEEAEKALVEIREVIRKSNLTAYEKNKEIVNSFLKDLEVIIEKESNPEYTGEKEEEKNDFPMQEETDNCTNCGCCDEELVKRNSSGELSCENCGYEEGNEN